MNLKILLFFICLFLIASCSSSSRLAQSSEITTTTTQGLAYTDGPDPVYDACTAAAANAQIIYQPKKEMTVGKVSTVSVVVTTDTVLNVTDVFPDGDQTTIVSAELACHVQARLSGQGFVIDPEGYQDRSFLGTKKVEWTWLATPEREGDDLGLLLEVQGVAYTPYGELPAGNRTFRADISVRADEETLFSKVNNVIVGIVEHPLVRFIGASGIIAGMAYLVQKARKREV